MSAAQVLIVVTIVLYLAAMLLIGFYFSRKGGSGSSDEFYIGGRKLGPLVTAMSAEASDMSSYLLMGLPGLAYFAGIAEVGWTAIGLAVGTYLNFLFVAKLLRRYTARLNAITIPDFFSRRYGDKRHLLSCIAALIIIIFFVPYTASGFKAVGTLFNSLFGIEYHTAMIFGAIVIISYTVMGGFLAVSTTDLVQSIFMSIALVVIVFFGIRTAGGMDAVIANAKELPGYLSLTDTTFGRIYGTSNRQGIFLSDTKEGYDIHPVSFLPILEKLYEKLYTENKYENIIGLRLLCTPSLYFWLMCYFMLLALQKKQRELIPMISFMIIFLLTILAGPCSLARYALPYIICLPTMWVCVET